MKKSVLILFMISCMNTLHSQQKTFSKVLIDADCNSIGEINSVVESYDSSYVLVGYNGNQGIIIKVDSDGEVVWEKQIGDPSVQYFPYRVLNSITSTYDSCYLISGYACTENCESTDALCIKINKDGDIIWSKSYNYGQASDFYSIQQTQDSGYVMIGSINNYSKILVSKINAAGDLQWANILEAKNHANYASGIKECADGSFIITGYAENGPPFTFHPFVLKLSSEGTIAWANQYTSNTTAYGIINDLEFTSNGFLFHSYYNHNTVAVLATDTAGVLLWSKMYNIFSYNTIGGANPKIHKTSDNAFVFISQNDTYYSSIVKIDSLGEVIWHRELEIDPIDVIETSNKEYFVPGNRLHITLPAQPGQNDCYPDFGLIQMDSMGNEQECLHYGSASSTVATLSSDTLIFSSSSKGVANTISLELYSELNYNAQFGCAIRVSGGSIQNSYLYPTFFYPNPSNGIFNLKLDGYLQAQLVVLNCLGQTVHEAFIDGQSAEIDMQLQPNGIYFFKLIFSQYESAYGKLLIRK